MEDEYVFPGFIFPAPKGHTQIPNTWYDEIISQIDNVSELKVVLYILRHTCGFQRAEEAQRLTVDEIMHGRIFNGRRIDRGTRLSEMSVRNGIKSAIKHGYIVCESDAYDKGNIKKCYKLRFSEVQSLDPKQELEVQSLDPTGTKSIPLEVQSLGEKGTNFRPDSPSGEKERERKGKERMKESTSIHPLSQDCLDKVAQVSQGCKDENASQHQGTAEQIYHQCGKSEDDFYGFLFHAEDSIRRRGPKTMQTFFERLQDFLEQS
jgi:hypothetical protein